MIAQKSVYRDTIDKLKNLPSTECESCQYLESCYGGCPVLWKNYSFDTMKKHKEMYVIKKTAAPEGTAANAQI